MTITKDKLAECFEAVPGAQIQIVIDKANEIWNDPTLSRIMIYAICYLVLTKE